MYQDELHREAKLVLQGWRAWIHDLAMFRAVS